MPSPHNQELEQLLKEILISGDQFLDGIQRSSSEFPNTLAALVQWSSALDRPLSDVLAVIEPCVRQSILISLIPAKAIAADYHGSIDTAVSEHLAALDITLDGPGRKILRDICINFNKLRGLNKQDARRATATLATVKANSELYNGIRARQGNRCLWCGADLDSTDVRESLEHISPKHIGDDSADGKNWGLACTTCNHGKADTLAWAATHHAHDYISRSDFETPNVISRQHRWAVLMRGRRCCFCDKTVLSTEIFVFRRTSTGLPVPSHCGLSCLSCGVDNLVDFLVPAFHPGEIGRSAHPPFGDS